MRFLFSTSVRQLGIFDSDTRAITHLGTTENTYSDIAYAPDGTIYGITQDALYTIRVSAGGVIQENRVYSLLPNQGWNALELSENGLYIAGRAALSEIGTSIASYRLIVNLTNPSGGDIAARGNQIILATESGSFVSYDRSVANPQPQVVFGTNIRGTDAIARTEDGVAVLRGDTFFVFSPDTQRVLQTITVNGVRGDFTGAANIPDAIPKYTVRTNRGETIESFPASPYVGPAEGIQWEFRGTPNSLEEVSGTSFSDFINALAGDDIVFGLAGNDILDGGTGSNFLEGGSGADTFFLDVRDGQVGWSTIVDFVPGVEQVTIWGYRPGVSRIFWEENYGAAGYTGATAFIDIDGSSQTDRSGVDFAVTFTGHSVQDIGPRYELDGLLWFRPAV